MNPPIVATGTGAFLLGAVLLGFSITRLLAVLKGSVMVQLPVVLEQTVEFVQAGSYILQIEQPRLDMALKQAKFALYDAAGRELPSSPSVFRTTVSGLSTTRISIRNFVVEQPGRYRLEVTGLLAGCDVSRCALIFTRPSGAAMFLCIVGILLGAAAMIVALVVTALIRAGKL